MKKFVVVGALFVCACVHKLPPVTPSATLEVLESTTMPAPSNAAANGGLRPYLIGPQDTLTVDVLGIEDLKERDILVDSNGDIAYPIVGVVRAAGLTPAQLQDELRTALQAGHVRQPRITVNVKKSLSQVVTVDGQVNEPGIYPVLGDMTLMRAVASAKGLTDFAKLDDVVVFRTVDGRRYAGLYNLGMIRRGAYIDPQIYPDDVVIVGDSPGRRMFDNIMRASGLITAPIIALVQSGTL